MDANYFDYAASSPVRDCAIAAMQAAMRSYFGNPSSPHEEGRRAYKLLNESKLRILDLLRCEDGRLVLCASGSEANNLVIEHVLHKYPNKKILCALDTHPCVNYVERVYPDRYASLAIDPSGVITVEQLVKAVSSDIGVVCLSHVCHETGVVQNVNELAAACARLGVPCLVDGVQAVGHIPVNVDKTQADWYTFAAHKYGGPKGIAGICVRGEALLPRVHGGRQEYAMRAGTENVPALCGALAALEEALGQIESETERLLSIKQHIIKNMSEKIPEIIFPGEGAPTSPNICACTIPQCESRRLIESLSIKGFFVASGSACTSESVKASGILLAMGLSEQEALGTVRISFGEKVTMDSANALVNAFVEVVEQERKQSR